MIDRIEGEHTDLLVRLTLLSRRGLEVPLHPIDHRMGLPVELPVLNQGLKIVELGVLPKESVELLLDLLDRSVEVP